MTPIFSLFARRLVAYCLIVILCLQGPGIYALDPVPTSKPTHYPAWWFEYGVIPRIDPANDLNPAFPGSYKDADDYAALNQGQLKHLALAAREHLAESIPGGSGQALDDMIENWFAHDLSTGERLVNPTTGEFVPAENSDNFAVVNLGQLKTVAQPFYDRLITAGFATDYPWTSAPAPADDFAVANIGQAKNLFAFELTGKTFKLTSSRYGHDLWLHYSTGERIKVLAFPPTGESVPPSPAASTFTPFYVVDCKVPLNLSEDWWIEDATTAEQTLPASVYDAQHAAQSINPDFATHLQQKWISISAPTQFSGQALSSFAVGLLWAHSAVNKDGLFSIEWKPAAETAWSEVARIRANGPFAFADSGVSPLGTYK